MLRSIGDIARSRGELLRTPDAQLACMMVFALGGCSASDDGSESAYFVIRSALAKSVSETATFVTERGIVQEGMPILLRLINQLAVRFEVNVTEKLAAKPFRCSVPWAGLRSIPCSSIIFRIWRMGILSFGGWSGSIRRSIFGRSMTSVELFQNDAEKQQTSAGNCPKTDIQIYRMKMDYQ